VNDPEHPELWDVYAASNIPELIWPTRKSKTQADKWLSTGNAIKMRRIKGIKKKKYRIRQYVSPSSYCSLTKNFIQKCIVGEC